MYVIIISLFQLRVVGLPVEREEEETVYEDMGETPRRAGRFSLVPTQLTFADELAATLRRRGKSPAIPDTTAVISPLVNLLVNFCSCKIPSRSVLPLAN